MTRRPTPGRECLYRRVIANPTSIIHDNDGLGPWTNQGFSCGNVDAERVEIDVAEHGSGARGKNGLKIGDVIERRRDHFIARTHACQQQR